MRNAETMNELKQELGRYQKRTADQGARIRTLQRDLEAAHKGLRETSELVDAVLTAVVLEHGAASRDPDAPETFLGWRLELPIVSVEKLREQYEIQARRENGAYVLGVVPRMPAFER